MAMTRIFCPSCGWTTKPHYSELDCVREKEFDHMYGLNECGYDAHDSAFGHMCPSCGEKAETETRYFSNEEIREIERKRSAGWRIARNE